MGKRSETNAITCCGSAGVGGRGGSLPLSRLLHPVTKWSIIPSKLASSRPPAPSTGGPQALVPSIRSHLASRLSSGLQGPSSDSVHTPPCGVRNCPIRPPQGGTGKSGSGVRASTEGRGPGQSPGPPFEEMEGATGTEMLSPPRAPTRRLQDQ